MTPAFGSDVQFQTGEMAWALDDILPEIVNAGDAGVTRGRIKEKVAKRYRDEISQALKALVNSKEVWGPVKHGNSEYYFASERGPSAKTAANVIDWYCIIPDRNRRRR
jgi:hypothetical protein